MSESSFDPEAKRIASTAQTPERVQAGEPCKEAHVVMADLKNRLVSRALRRSTPPAKESNSSQAPAELNMG